MAHLYKNKRESGALLVELLIAFGLTAVLLPALITGFVSASRGTVGYSERIQAMGLLREAEDVVRSIREQGWNLIATNGVYHPEVSGGEWILVSGSETLNGFNRSITISDFSQNGQVDPSIKQFRVEVGWESAVSRTAESTFYLSRYLGNSTLMDTTEANFNQGTNTGTRVVNDFGGEVQLGAGGKADWCAPSISAIDPIDLPKNGVANAVSAIEGRVFAGTGDNASGVSFAKVSITNSDPPTGTIDATFDGYKTNGVFGDANYAYLATDNNSKEVVIMNLNNIVSGKYQEIGSFNAPGNGNGNSVYVSGNYGFMTGSSGNKFYNFNKPGGSLSIDGDGVTLDNVGNKIYVVGSYAYVATNGTTNQLNIIDISSPTNLVKTKSFSVNGGVGRDVYVNSLGTRAYFVTASSSTQAEFFIIDITDKSNPTVIGTYDTSGMSPKGVTIVPGNKALVVGTGGLQQYQVIDITTETSPVHCTSGGRSGGLTISTGVNGISSVLEADGDAYSYIITGDSSSELKIIEGGPGGIFSDTGTYTSRTFDLGSEVAFNKFINGVTIPGGVTAGITFQFAGADPVNGSCDGASFDFVDPINLQIPLNSDGVGYENPARCFKYRATLTTSDSAYSPSLNDITINYSP